MSPAPLEDIYDSVYDPSMTSVAPGLGLLVASLDLCQFGFGLRYIPHKS